MGLLQRLLGTPGRLVSNDLRALHQLLGTGKPQGRPLAPQTYGLRTGPDPLITDVGDHSAVDAPYPNILRGLQWGNNPHPAGRGIPLLNAYRDRPGLQPGETNPFNVNHGQGDSPYLPITPFTGIGNIHQAPQYFNNRLPNLPMRSYLQ